MPEPGERIIVIDDLISSGQTLNERIEFLIDRTKTIAAILVIAQREEGAILLEKTYKTKVLSVIHDEDIICALKDGII